VLQSHETIDVTSKKLVKDDRHLIEAIEQGRSLRSALGIPEPSETRLGNVAELREEWQKLRQEKSSKSIALPSARDAGPRQDAAY
jgi:hypothetical protein